jgi:F-type H+-transporting ATPase subunit gamma
MSDTTASLGRKINSAAELQSVVRTMKALAASSIGQYEQSVKAVADYSRSIELGLGACFREIRHQSPMMEPTTASGAAVIGAVVFGSDQGLVGKFNELVADYALKTLAAMPCKPQLWVVGEQVYSRLADSGLPLRALFNVPTSVQAISPLVGQLLLAYQAFDSRERVGEFYLFYNHPASGAVFAPVSQRLLPLDEVWRRQIAELPWPRPNLPEVMGGGETLRALIREYLFVSLFRACAESLASENASRLAAMQRADKNIDELLENLHSAFHRLRQSGIDDELFDVISGYEALSKAKVL